MLAANPGLQWLVAHLPQQSNTSNLRELTREYMGIRLPRWTVSLPHKLPLGVEECCYLHQSLVDKHSCLHQPLEVGAPGRVQHQTRIICWRLTFGVCARVVSVSNSSKSALRFRVKVGTELEPLQWLLPKQKTEPHRTRSFLARSTILHTQHIDSNSVFEFKFYHNMIYTYKMQFWTLSHHLVSDLRSDQYSLSHCTNSRFSLFIHGNSINIDRIANWRQGGETACKTASFKYISYCDTIRTQIHNWSQCTEFAKMNLCCMYNTGKKQRF